MQMKQIINHSKDGGILNMIRRTDPLVSLLSVVATTAASSEHTQAADYQGSGHHPCHHFSHYCFSFNIYLTAKIVQNFDLAKEITKIFQYYREKKSDLFVAIMSISRENVNVDFGLKDTINKPVLLGYFSTPSPFGFAF